MTSFNGLGSISNISILFVVVIVALLCGEILVYSASIETQDGFFAMIVGLLSGSLTTPPAFSAPKATVDLRYTGLVSVGQGIAYSFGVIGVVLISRFLIILFRFEQRVHETNRDP